MSNRTIKEEFRYINNFINNLKEHKYSIGDKIRANQVLRTNGVCYDGAVLTSMEHHGILECCGTELVLWKKNDSWNPEIILTPEDILNPNFRGTVYTRKIYKIVIDDFKVYLQKLIANEI